MSSEDWRLIVIAICAFAALGTLGWIRNKLWVWRWADMLYYPLGALGIVLLFFTNDINRTLLRIEANRVAAEQEWRLRPNARPDLRFDATPAVLLQARFAWFNSVQDLGKSCENSPTPDCGPYSEQGRAARDSFAKFSMPSGDDSVALARAEEAFCRAAFDDVDRLDGGTTLAVDAYAKLRIALGRISKGMDPDRVKAALQNGIAEDQRIAVLAMNDKERRLAEPYLRLHGRHALDLFDQIRWCATRPGDTAANLKLLDAWQAEEQTRAQTRARIDRDLDAAKANGALSPMQHVSRMIQQQWWPYILILALSIKFGKACSAVAPDFDRTAKRLRSGVGSIARRLPRSPRQATESDTDGAGDPPPS